jgi:ABC-type polysaccharide/polyol phosphate export permease
MLRNLRNLVRYRGLIQTLVARDLKARYRGSVLGFFWSFFNPLLLLLVYSFVFSTVLPSSHTEDLQPYALFMFCGILPWTWFSSSILESANVLIAGGNLIKKVLFPAEVLPIVTVLANMVHFFLGLPILIVFLIYYQRPLDPVELLWFPVIVFVQLLVLLGLGLLVAALTVHFRDLKEILGNLLTLWFLRDSFAEEV